MNTVKFTKNSKPCQTILTISWWLKIDKFFRLLYKIIFSKDLASKFTFLSLFFCDKYFFQKRILTRMNWRTPWCSGYFDKTKNSSCNLVWLVFVAHCYGCFAKFGAVTALNLVSSTTIAIVLFIIIYAKALFYGCFMSLFCQVQE